LAKKRGKRRVEEVRQGFGKFPKIRKGGSKMKITDVRVRKVSEDGKMKAVVSVTFDDEFVVHDIKIIEGQNGLFIAMPSRKMGEGDFRDIAHPLISETRNRIKDAIFAEYEKVMDERDDENLIAMASSQ
jgi:stage V sporulation protein G